MYIVAHDRSGQVLKIPITSVVVYDDFDQPLSVAVRIMDRTAIVAHACDKDFEETLKTLGIDKLNVRLDYINPKKI